MNTLSDYANKRKVGIYFGYPKCCIEFYMKSIFDKNMQNEVQQSMEVSNETGFIPCTKHAQQIMKKEITLSDILCNRECETTFPNGRGIAIEQLRLKKQHIRVMQEIQQK